jgi:hypothetical protein
MYTPKSLFVFSLMIVLIPSSYAQQSDRQKKLDALKEEKAALLKDADAKKKQLGDVSSERKSTEGNADKQKELFGNPLAVEQEAVDKANEFLKEKVVACNDGHSYLLMIVNPAVNRSLKLYSLVSIPTSGMKSVVAGQSTSQGDWGGVLTVTSPTVTIYQWANLSPKLKTIDERDLTMDFSMNRKGGYYDSYKRDALAGGRWNISVKAEKAWLNRDTSIVSPGTCEQITKFLAGPSSKTIR